MGRRKPGALFGEDNPDLIDVPMRADPPDNAELAEDEKVALDEMRLGSTEGPEGTLLHAAKRKIGNLKPPEKEKRTLSPEEKARRRQRKEARDREMKERPLRDMVRERAAKKQFSRIKMYEDIVDDPAQTPQTRMEAAKRLDEMAIDRTPLAQSAQVMRPRILVGRIGESSRPGGDKVLPDKFEPYVAPSSGGGGPAEDADD